MAKPRHKGKSKQRKTNKPKVVIEATAVPVSENSETEVQDTSVMETEVETLAQPKELTEKEKAKLEKEQAKKDKAIAKEKANKKKQEAREKSGKVGLKQRFKETGSELKKISWPSFKEVMKKTGVVIAVVLFFSVVLFAFDYLLSFLNGLLV